MTDIGELKLKYPVGSHWNVKDEVYLDPVVNTDMTSPEMGQFFLRNGRRIIDHTDIGILVRNPTFRVLLPWDSLDLLLVKPEWDILPAAAWPSGEIRLVNDRDETYMYHPNDCLSHKRSTAWGLFQRKDEDGRYWYRCRQCGLPMVFDHEIETYT
jgi:hypothetical protein